jgi:D-alanyl-D-alanine endopeptidase (penicillin-binding protein 7)
VDSSGVEAIFKEMITKVFAILLLFSSSALAQSSSYYVFDQTDSNIIVGEFVAERRPVASLTKLMTALLVVESNVSLGEEVKYRGGIFQTKMVKRGELLESLLIRSDNAAAEALAASWYGGRERFVKDMNTRAKQLGMGNTVYADPSGLDRHNVSTAIDQSILISAAAQYPIIAATSSSKYITIERKTKKKINYVSIGNTNKNLLFEFDNIILSKTGFTNPAGRCLALMVEKDQHKFVIVILGEKTTIDRENRARQLINNYVTIKERNLDDRVHLFNF